MRFAHGLFEKEQKPPKPLVLFSIYILTFFFIGPILTCVSSSDFENKFVCGEIMSYDDLKEHGSEAAVKAAGKLRQQGKPYESTLLCCLKKQILILVLQVIDGDIAYWKAGG